MPAAGDLANWIDDDSRQVLEWVAGLPSSPNPFAHPDPQGEAASLIIEAARGRPAAAVALLNHLVGRAAAGSGQPIEERLTENLLRLLGETTAEEFPHDTVLDLLPRLWQAGCGNWREGDGLELDRWDWATEALNHWAGIAARIAVHAADCEWASSEPPASEMSDRARAVLEQMIGGDRYPHHLAQTVLATFVCLLHHADREWSFSHVLPLFDPGEAERARRCWNAYLSAGRFDQELLDDRMLDRYSAMCSRTDVLADGDRHRFAQHCAELAVLVRLNPDERRISRLIADSDLGPRLEWIGQVVHQLKGLPPQDADAQWDRWMRDHWEDRLRGSQKVLEEQEATAMANWLPCLDSCFPEAVGLACKRKAPLTDANLLMAAHLSGEGAKAGQKDAGRHLQTHPQQVAALIAHMMKSTHQLPGMADSSVGSDLAELVAQLQGAVGGELAEELAEQSIRLDLQSHP